mgnify:FL=1
MRFHAAFRATHCRRSFGDIHIFPVTHKKGLTLTWRQLFYFFFNNCKDLCLLEAGMRGCRGIRPLLYLQSFQGVGIFVVGWGKSREQRGPEGTNFLPAVKIANRVLQDALEKHRQFCRWLVSIFFRQFEHRILHDIQRRLVVAYSKQCLLVGAPLDAGEKIRQFSSCGQDSDFHSLRGDFSIAKCLDQRGTGK